MQVFVWCVSYCCSSVTKTEMFYHFFRLSNIKFNADLFIDRRVATYGETDRQRRGTTNGCVLALFFMNTAKR